MIRLLAARAALVSCSIAVSGSASAQLPFNPTQLADAAEKVTPAVVSVTSRRSRPISDEIRSGRDRERDRERDRDRDPTPPVGEPRERSSIELGYGSGVVISADGLIVTNSHLIEDEDDISVVFANETRFLAKLIGRDTASDLALIKVPAAQKLAFAAFGDSSKVRLGEIVLAIGNPFGIGQTATMGIVSAKSRATRTLDYEDFIQTDASINPGNAGGALVNLRGELVGINTDVLTSQRPGQGIGFAVPSNMAKPIIEQLLQNGRVRRGWIGVSIQDLSPEIARQLQLKDTKGVLVSEVLPGPASRAGISSGDVITRVGETLTGSSPELRNLVALMKPGSRVKVSLIRDRKRLNVTVTLDEKPADQARDPKEPRSEKPASKRGVRDGLSLVELGPSLRARLGVPAGTGGAVVADVDAGSSAERAGLRPGDVITAAGKRRVRSIADFNRWVKDDEKGVLLNVLRGGHNTFVMLEPRAR